MPLHRVGSLSTRVKRRTQTLAAFARACHDNSTGIAGLQWRVRTTLPVAYYFVSSRVMVFRWGDRILVLRVCRMAVASEVLIMENYQQGTVQTSWALWSTCSASLTLRISGELIPVVSTAKLISSM